MEKYNSVEAGVQIVCCCPECGNSISILADEDYNQVALSFTNCFTNALDSSGVVVECDGCGEGFTISEFHPA